MRGAEYWTDHRLICSTFKAVLRPPARKQPPKPRLNVADIGNIEVRRNLIPKLDSEFDSISISGDILDDNQANQDVEELWSSMIDILKSSSEEILGFFKRKNPDWFNESAEEILPLLALKNAPFQAHLAHPQSCSYKNGRKDAP